MFVDKDTNAIRWAYYRQAEEYRCDGDEESALHADWSVAYYDAIMTGATEDEAVEAADTSVYAIEGV